VRLRSSIATVTTRLFDRLTGTRKCARCRCRFPHSSYVANRRTRSGLSSWCRSCAVERTRLWRAEHRETYNARKRAIWAERADEINERRRARYVLRATRNLSSPVGGRP
jgi:hypothetical protein